MNPAAGRAYCGGGGRVWPNRRDAGAAGGSSVAARRSHVPGCLRAALPAPISSLCTSCAHVALSAPFGRPHAHTSSLPLCGEVAGRGWPHASVRGLRRSTARPGALRVCTARLACCSRDVGGERQSASCTRTARATAATSSGDSLPIRRCRRSLLAVVIWSAMTFRRAPLSMT